MRIVKRCRPSAATDGRGEARKNAGRSGQSTPAQVVGAEGVPLRAIARQQSQQLRMPKSGPCRAISVSKRY